MVIDDRQKETAALIKTESFRESEMRIGLLLAGGQGKRANAGQSKALLSIGGRPLIDYSLAVLSTHSSIDSIVIVIEKDLGAIIKKLLSTDKKVVMVEPGRERQDSAFLGLKAAGNIAAETGDKDHLVVIHDASNPFITAEDVSSVIRVAEQDGAATCGVANDEPLRLVRSGKTDDIIGGKGVWRLRTPFCGKLEILQKAYADAFSSGMYHDDDTALVMRSGKDVTVVPTSTLNTRIVSELDIRRAEHIMGLHQIRSWKGSGDHDED
ncbi:MAG: 2-C-methyl-D-erythritol 4-phosphate cytidylyltransferase [archaeon]